jgi:hypothetical protein
MVRLLAFDYFTSTIGQVVHRIDHKQTELVRRQHGLIIHVKAICYNDCSPMHIVFLTDDDAEQWVTSVNYLKDKYGPRRWCRWCK